MAWECVRLSGYDSFSEILRDELDGQGSLTQGWWRESARANLK